MTVHAFVVFVEISLISDGLNKCLPLTALRQPEIKQSHKNLTLEKLPTIRTRQVEHSKNSDSCSDSLVMCNRILMQPVGNGWCCCWCWWCRG